MKAFSKLFSITLALVLGCMFVSCSDGDDSIENPRIKLENRENTEVKNGSIIMGEITSTSELTSIIFFYVKGDSSEVFKTVTSFDNHNSYVFNEELANVTSNITGVKIIAENKDGGKTEIVIPVTVIPVLSSPITFILGYSEEGPSSFPNSAYGITYNKNNSATQALFTGTFVMMNQTSYNYITTKYDIIAEVESGDKIASLTAGSGSSFTSKYFISVKGSTYYLIEMTELIISNNSTATFTVRQ